MTMAYLIADASYLLFLVLFLTSFLLAVEFLLHGIPGTVLNPLRRSLFHFLLPAPEVQRQIPVRRVGMVPFPGTCDRPGASPDGDLWRPLLILPQFFPARLMGFRQGLLLRETVDGWRDPGQSAPEVFPGPIGGLGERGVEGQGPFPSGGGSGLTRPSWIFGRDLGPGAIPPEGGPGQKSRHKTVEIKGLTADQLYRLLDMNGDKT